ncbi:MAG: hypothetical protein NTV23_03250 [Propionibacteriales bacterium]|nr:hypothetical protein [Propionibacteriales bacterium]
MSAELLQRSAAGDVDAFMSFYDQTCAVVFEWALRSQRDRARAEDLTRALYARAWVSASDHASSGISPLAWLISIAPPRNPVAPALKLDRCG